MADIVFTACFLAPKWQKDVDAALNNTLQITNNFLGHYGKNHTISHCYRKNIDSVRLVPLQLLNINCPS